MDRQEQVNESLWQELKDVNSKLMWRVSYRFIIVLLLVIVTSLVYMVSAVGIIKIDIRSIKNKLAPYSIEYQD